MTEKQIELKKKKSASSNIKVFIVKTAEFANETLCGITMCEILARETEGFEIVFLDDCKDLLFKIKNSSAFCDRVAVLFSCCPCIERRTVELAFNSSQMAVSFGKSFVASSNFLKSMQSFESLKEFELEFKDEFLVVHKHEHLDIVRAFLQRRIKERLEKTGVQLQDCYIEFNCEIESGARLAGSHFLGDCNVGASIVLGSSLDSCIVASGVHVENCVLKNCVITRDIKEKKIDGGII